MNSKKLLRNFEFSESEDCSTVVVDPEEERRGPGPFVQKDKDSTHTFNNKGQNCMERKLNDLPHGHMRGHHLLDYIATSIAG